MSSPHTPPSKKPIQQADTIKKNCFFHAVDQKGKKSLKQMCQDEKVPLNTANKWLFQRKELGTPIASRRINKRCGRPIKTIAEKLNEMLNDKKNLVRDQPWDVQIDHFQLNCTSRTLQRACNSRTPKAGQYKMAKVKALSHKNKQLRVEYSRRHQDKTVESFWQYVHFTDKTHIDPNQLYSKFVLREEGTWYESENLPRMPDMKGVQLHFVASILWHHKSSLLFYNDEHDPPPVITKKPRKPRKLKYQTEDQYHERVID